MSNIEKGAEVYLEDGSKATYIAEFDGMHIVSPFYEDDEGFIRTGKAREVKRIFTSELAEVYAPKVQELRQQIDEHQNELRTLRESIADAKKESADLMTRLKSHDALKHIDDFIAGRITHFVTIGYGNIEVQTKEDALKHKDRYDSWQKLLTLYGDSKGNLQYKINHYSDGSGSSVDCMPFLSEQDAIEYAKEKILLAIDALKDKGHKDYIENMIKSAEKINLDVPQWATDWVKSKRIENFRYQLNKAEEETAKWLKCLEEAQQ